MNQAQSSGALQCTDTAPSYAFSREELSPELFGEMIPLLLLHYKEIAHYQDIELKPDQATYEKIAASGCLRIFTIRRSDTRALIGYCVFFVKANMHYADSVQAVQDILFLHPDFRGRMTGYRFIKYCDDELRAEGVQVVYHHVKEVHNFGPMLERIGYQLVDHIYGRRLDNSEGR